MRVVAHDLYPDPQWAAGAGVTYLPLPDLLTAADILTLHTPATPQTYHLLNAERLACCKRGVLVVNTARGDLIDEVALLAALESGQVGGAALDVFEQEPPGPGPLLRHPKVLPTAHCAGSTVEAQRRGATMALEEVLRVAAGQPPLYPVNRPLL